MHHKVGTDGLPPPAYIVARLVDDGAYPFVKHMMPIPTGSWASSPEVAAREYEAGLRDAERALATRDPFVPVKPTVPLPDLDSPKAQNSEAKRRSRARQREVSVEELTPKPTKPAKRSKAKPPPGLPQDLRQRVLACLARGMSKPATAREAKVGLTTIKKWQARGDADVLAALAEGKAAKAKVAA